MDLGRKHSVKNHQKMAGVKMETHEQFFKRMENELLEFKKKIAALNGITLEELEVLLDFYNEDKEGEKE